MREKKIQFSLCAAGNGEKKGIFDSILYLKYFIHALKLRWPTEKLLWLPEFLSSSCHPLESQCGPLGAHVTHFENHCFQRLMQAYVGSVFHQIPIKGFIEGQFYRGSSVGMQRLIFRVLKQLHIERHLQSPVLGVYRQAYLDLLLY